MGMQARRLIFSLVATLLILSLVSNAYAAVATGVSVTGVSISPGAFDPANGSAAIKYTISNRDNSDVTVTIVNGAGTVRTMYQGIEDQGQYLVNWDGRDNNGVYVSQGTYTANVKAVHTYDFLRQWGNDVTKDGILVNPAGVAVNKNTNKVYVVDKNNYRVQVFDANGNYLRQWGTRGTGNGQFNTPQYLAINSAGNVYVSDGNRVQAFDQDGNYLSLITAGSTVKGLAFNSTGYLYVALPSSVAIYSPAGVLASQINYPSGPGKLNSVYGIGINSTNYVYVADYAASQIIIFDKTGNYVSSLATPYNGWTCTGIAFNSTDYAYAAQGYAVLIYDTAGKTAGTVAKPGVYFNSAFGVAFDSTGSMYVSESMGNCVDLFSPARTYVKNWGVSNTAPGLLKSPYAMTVNSTGYVYVVDYDGINKYVNIYDNFGNYVGTDALSGMNVPNVMTTDNTGKVYGSSYYTIYVMDSNCHLLSTLGTSSGTAGPGKFSSITSLATDATGNLYVLDCGFNNVQVFDKDGNFLRMWGTAGTSPGQINGPYDIAVNSTGFVYLANYGNQRVDIFDANGVFQYSLSNKGFTGSSWYPIQIAFANGYVLVTDTWNNVRMFDNAGNYVASFSLKTAGDKVWQAYSTSVVTDQAGNLLVLDNNNRQVNEYSYSPSSATGQATVTVAKGIPAQTTANPLVPAGSPATLSMDQLYAHGSVVHTTTPTATATATATATPTATVTATPAPTVTATPVVTPTAAPVDASTPTAAPSPSDSQNGGGLPGGILIWIGALVVVVLAIGAAYFLLLRK